MWINCLDVEIMDKPLTEKEIMYFISSYSRDSDRGIMKFVWPVSPDPQMGKRFLKKIKGEFSQVEEWIKNNPEKFKMAQNGYYRYK